MSKDTYLGIAAPQALRTGLDPQGTYREGLILQNGRISDVFMVAGGPVLVTGMFMQITQAVTNAACNMTWVASPLLGSHTVIGDSVNIQAAVVGDWFWAECDGTALIKAATGTTLPVAPSYRGSATGLGILVPEGSIDIGLSAGLDSGKGTLYIQYIPLVRNAVIYASDLRTSTTSSSTSTTTTSSSTTSTTTSSSSSSSSSTSSSSSSSSTSSTTSSTSSTTSTTSSSSSTASTASSTSSTTSTASTASSTTSTTSTTSSEPP